MKHDLLDGYSDRERAPVRILRTHSRMAHTWWAPATAMIVVSIWFAFFL